MPKYSRWAVQGLNLGHPIPQHQDQGRGRTDNICREVTLEGQIGTYPAKAAVAEVFVDLKETDFSRDK